MRPLRLEVEGFTSFRERACLDFSGFDLFAITGPTGAGKSSLIDAMVLALYGQVPRVGDRYKQLISHGAERMSVRLDFAVGREHYRVVRTIREAGASQARLERLVDGGVTPMADRVKDIQEHVDRIVGLDYDAFTRSVVLPQGEFDAFLKGKPDERRKILVALLNLGVYEKMHAVVNRQAADARREAEFIAGQLAADYAGATPESLAAKRQELERAESEVTRLETAESALALALPIAQALRGARREVEGLLRDVGAETGRRKKAESTLDGATRRRAVLDARAAGLAERIAGPAFDESRQMTLTAARPLAEQLAEAAPQLARLTRESAERTASLQAKKTELAAAEARLPVVEAVADARRDDALRAREALDDLRLRHAAHAIRAQLAPGDPCPVCERALESVPRGTLPGLREAEATSREAERVAEDARRTLDTTRVEGERLRGTVERLEGEAQGLAARGDETRAIIARIETSLAAAGFERSAISNPAPLLEALRRELQSLEQARAERDRLQVEARKLEDQRLALESEVVAARSQAEVAAQRLEELARRHVEAEESVASDRRRLLDLARREGWAGLDPAPAGHDEQDLLEANRASLQKALTGAHARKAGLEKDMAAQERDLAKAAELRGRKRALETRAALSGSLAQHLQANQFLAYVQEEALRVLAEDGSRSLKQLSQGRYSLDNDAQDFCVIDHWNGDVRRSVKTLSGGETFLASLALALALAERLAELSAEGRSSDTLESLFLDEGFGTLDPEALDLVVQAIETLQGGQRMVGLVTHIPELADRMPTRVQVSSTAGNASLSVA